MYEAFGLDTQIQDQCLAPGQKADEKIAAAGGGPTASYCTCVRDYGFYEVERSARATLGIWTYKVQEELRPLWLTVASSMRQGSIRRGGPYARYNAPFDWTADAGRFWWRTMMSSGRVSAGLVRAGVVLGNVIDQFAIRCGSTACDELRAEVAACSGDCTISTLRLDNGCVARSERGDPYTEFGGPVLEFFNFRRVIRTLQQLDRRQWSEVLPADFLQNYTLQQADLLLKAIRAAKTSLVNLLGGGVQWLSPGVPWEGYGPFVERQVPSAVPGGITVTNVMDQYSSFNKALSDAAFARLTRPAWRDPLVVAALGHEPPFERHEVFNLLRYWVQRTPGAGPWDSVHNVERFSAQYPDSTPAFFTRHPATLELVPGDWLNMMLGILAPGWRTGWSMASRGQTIMASPYTKPKGDSQLVAPSTSALKLSAPVVVAGVGAAALLWFLL